MCVNYILHNALTVKVKHDAPEMINDFVEQFGNPAFDLTAIFPRIKLHFLCKRRKYLA